MKSVCIVIPVHKSKLDEHEIISLQRCRDVLGKYDSILLAPEGLDVSEYLDINPCLSVNYVNPDWLANIKGYNKMKISYDFYDIFREYQFLLTYELDAYVFYDELAFWCNRGFDYIGAPWFSGYDQATPNSQIVGVGNSGFSLRNVQKCLFVLGQLHPLIGFSKRTDLFPIKYLFRYITYATSFFPRLHFKLHILRAYLNHEYVHEDLFWSKFIPALFSDFKIAPVADALKFSFDAAPRLCYQLNNMELPFGCHAWAKFDKSFWNQFISKYSDIK